MYSLSVTWRHFSTPRISSSLLSVLTLCSGKRIIDQKMISSGFYATIPPCVDSLWLHQNSCVRRTVIGLSDIPDMITIMTQLSPTLSHYEALWGPHLISCMEICRLTPFMSVKTLSHSGPDPTEGLCSSEQMGFKGWSGRRLADHPRIFLS